MGVAKVAWIVIANIWLVGYLVSKLLTPKNRVTAAYYRTLLLAGAGIATVLAIVH